MQQRPVVRVEQGVAPIQRRPYRSVPVGGPRAAGQHAQLIGEPGGQALQPQRRPAGGSQLNRQRDAVQAPADCGDVLAEHRIRTGTDRRRPIEEQRDGVGLGLAVQRHRRHRVDVLVRHHWSSPASGQHRQARAPGEQSLHERGHPGQHLLTVVQDQQRLAIGQGVDHRLADAATRLLADAQRPGDRGDHHAGVGDRHQVDEPPTVGVLTGDVGGDGHREPSLADAAGADRRHLPMRFDHLGKFVALPPPADERRQLHGQNRRRRGPAGGVRLGVLGGPLGQNPPVRHVQLAQQRRDVTFDGTHGDKQLRGDLGVGQVLAEQAEHLHLPCRDVLDRPPGCQIAYPLADDYVVRSVVLSVAGTDAADPTVTRR